MGARRAEDKMLATAVRRMAASSKQGSGGLFENRLVNTFDPWLHRTSVPSAGEVQHRATVNARWMAKSLKYNSSMLPWGGAAIIVGYFFIQQALPDSLRIA